MPDLQNILVHFLPELILVAGALGLLGYDLLRQGAERHQAWIAGGTLLLALLATLWLYTVPPPFPAPVAITGASGNTVATCSQYGIFEVRATATDGGAGSVIRCGAFVADGFTQFFRFLAQLSSLLVVCTGVAFMRRRTPFRGEFFAILLFATVAMSLMAGASDLLLIALSIEFLSLASYILTGFLRGDPFSAEAGVKYFLYGSITGAAMLFGLSLLYGVTGSTSVPVLAAALAAEGGLPTAGIGALVLPALVMVLAGLGFKIALVPFHQWAPDAYQGAPTPVTAFLSVGPKLAGFAVLLRLLATAFGDPAYSGGWLAVLTGIAVVTMVVGNITALTQTNVKRMMAYSSIAQAGYMLVGLSAFSGQAMGETVPLASILVFLVAYVFTNLGAFAVIVGVDEAVGSSELAAYAGLMQRSPLLAVPLAVFFLSLVGIPPLAGFLGKFAVFSAALGNGQLGLAVVGVLTGVISVGYYFRVLREVFFQDAPEGACPIQVAPGLRLAIVVALVMTFAVGLLATPVLDWADQAAAVIAPAVGAVTAGLVH